MKRTALALTALLLVACNINNQPSKEMDRFIYDLMDRMTVEEKIGQLNLTIRDDFFTGQEAGSSRDVKTARISVTD